MTKFNRTLFILVAVNLVSKLVLLDWNGAEYSDSMYYLILNSTTRSKWLPIYPVLIHFTKLFVRDPTFSGRLTSMIMSTLSILPLYSITKRLYNKRAALYAALLYIVAPVITRWSIRVMTEATFTFFLLLALWLFTKWYDSRKNIHAAGVLALSGVAALVRPEGIGLLPIVLVFAVYILYKQKIRAVHWVIIGLIPWAFQLFWHWKVVGKYGYGAELQGGAKRVTVSKFFYFLGLYPAYLPYIVTPVVFALAVYGIYKSIRSRNEESIRKIYHIIVLCVLIVWLLGLSVHWAWTTRFLYPIVALLLIFSGYGISCIKNVRSRKAVLAVCMVTSVAFTIVVLICSRATFGDIRKSSYFIRDNLPPDAKIVSTEPGKVRFWSERAVGGYKRADLKPGMYVVLQNIYCDFEREMIYLKEKHGAEVLYYNAGTVMPILADEMHLRAKKRADGTIAMLGSGNRAIELRTQFSRYRFESAVLLVKN